MSHEHSKVTDKSDAEYQYVSALTVELTMDSAAKWSRQGQALTLASVSQARLGCPPTKSLWLG